MFCHVQFCTLNVHINICFCMGFRHAHLCTNDHPCSYGFSSCTSLYEWLSILFLYGFSSCKCLYEWLPISLWMGFRHVHVCTNYYPFPCEWVLVMYISVRMNIHSFWMGFRHVHVCTNDYPIPFEWVFVMYMFVRMTTISFWMDCHHARFCANDYHLFLKGLSSFTFLYEWLPFHCV